MAIGDDAAAAGMDIVPQTGKVKDGATEINKTRDYIAQRTAEVTPIARGGTGAATAAAARDNLGVTAQLDTKLTRTSAQYNADFQSRDNAIAAVNGLVATVRSGGFNSEVWNRNQTGTRRAAWIQNDGAVITLGHTASSRRYKKNITPLTITDEQVQLLQVVTFNWRSGHGPQDSVEVGLIAEDLIDAGLGWAVFTDEEGRPEGIHYEMIALALIGYVQRLHARVTALEQHHAGD